MRGVQSARGTADTLAIATCFRRQPVLLNSGVAQGALNDELGLRQLGLCAQISP